MKIPTLEIRLSSITESIIGAVMIQEEIIKRNVEIAMDQMRTDGTLDRAIQEATRQAVQDAIKKTAQSWGFQDAIQKMILGAVEPKS